MIFTRLAPFFAVEEVSGGPLLIATIIAVLWVNGPWAASYHTVWQITLGVSAGTFHLEKSMAEWARDALLPVFFFGIGIEVKRELVKGLLSNRATAMLPLACAVGGMAAPALIYCALNAHGAFARGWGVTVTTDTAFALALLGIFATRLPRSVRVLLLAFAAVDDIGGLLVIAFVYTQHVRWGLLAVAAVLYLLVIVLRRLQIISSVPYVILGIGILLLVAQSGVHSTIAGVMLGALVPVFPRVPEKRFAQVVQKQVDHFQSAHRQANEDGNASARQEAVEKQEARLGQLSETAHATYETAQRITHGINPWVSYIVLPLFALSNAGVLLSPTVVGHAMTNTVALGIVAGLVIGKPLGILLFAFIATRTRIARIPTGVTWRMLAAIAVSSGIGFTISLFISDLAFTTGSMAEDAKLGVLLASLIAGTAGYLTFRWAVRRPHGGAEGAPPVPGGERRPETREGGSGPEILREPVLPDDIRTLP